MFSPPVAARCHAARCARPTCFRIELHEAPYATTVIRAADTCADHLGDTVQSLTRWAAALDMSDGHLSVSAVDAPPCEPAFRTGTLMPSFRFASIPVAL
jgi:hypothetical protein